MIQYKLHIGSMYFISDMGESAMLVEKAWQEKMLDDYVGNGIEVTVNY